MTQYIVHLYREMRLSYAGIEADSLEAAAAIARDKPTADADDIQDCEGETLTALVDVAGDTEYEQSRIIDFEQEQQRRAAPALLAALEAILLYAELAHEAARSEKPRHNPDCEAEAEQAAKAVEAAQAAIAQAKAAGILPAAADMDIHALLAERRQIALIWNIEDVQEIRPDLTANQCWQVLKDAARRHHPTIGLNWDVLSGHADMLFGAPEPDEAEEAYLRENHLI